MHSRWGSNHIKNLQNFEDFTGEFFHYLNLIADTLNGLEDRDAIARFGTRCLSAVSVHDNTLENVETLDDAQAKFDDILDSPSIDPIMLCSFEQFCISFFVTHFQPIYGLLMKREAARNFEFLL